MQVKDQFGTNASSLYEHKNWDLLGVIGSEQIWTGVA